jgi:hypothetical protein
MKFTSHAGLPAFWAPLRHGHGLAYILKLSMHTHAKLGKHAPLTWKLLGTAEAEVKQVDRFSAACSKRTHRSRVRLQRMMFDSDLHMDRFYATDLLAMMSSMQRVNSSGPAGWLALAKRLRLSWDVFSVSLRTSSTVLKLLVVPLSCTRRLSTTREEWLLPWPDALVL